MNNLKANHLSKSYKKRQVVKDVSININSGEVVGLLGPNGAGKTTCFYMIAGLISADSGEIVYNEINLTKQPIHKRATQGISYLPQEASVFRKLSVKDNLLAIIELYEQEPNKKQEQLNHLLDEFNLAHLSNTLGISLSGGERRRLEIARCMATYPKFILLDEPFAGIDPLSVIEIKQYILKLKHRGIGVLITDHNVRETLDICNRGYIISSGKVLAKGDVAELISNQKVKEVYLGEDFAL